MRKAKLNTVLLIDDNVTANFVLHKLIKMQDVAEYIYTCTSAEQALALMKVNHEASGARAITPNIIFLDINMPGMDGWEFIKEYRKMEKGGGPEPNIFLLTSSTSPSDMLMARAEGSITGFLNKPLSFDKVKEIFDIYIE